MKMNYLIFIAVSFMSFGMFAQHSGSSEDENPEENHHCLFKRNSMTLSVNVPYSFQIKSIGINARAYYNIGEQICFGPEFSFFNKNDFQLFEYNFVGHYIFETKLVGIYPVAGLNFTKETDGHEFEEALGALFGGGVHRNFGRFTFFLEYSHIQSRLQDDFLTIGAMLSIK